MNDNDKILEDLEVAGDDVTGAGPQVTVNAAGQEVSAGTQGANASGIVGAGENNRSGYTVSAAGNEVSTEQRSRNGGTEYDVKLNDESKATVRVNDL